MSMTIFYKLIVAYAIIVLLMAVFQRKLMYHPSTTISSPASYGLNSAQDITIRSDDGTKLQLWYQEAQPGKPTIIYFHGNAGNIADRAHQFDAFTKAGLGVAMVNYRGYGKSEGNPTEQGIYNDARATIKWVKSRGIPLHEIAFFGESLGTGVAVKMANEFEPRALFLQAPYMSVVGRAAEIYWYVPVKLLIRDHFNSMENIKKIRSPLVVFHGAKDTVIPIRHGKTLLEAAPEPKQGIFFDEVAHTDFDGFIISQHVIEQLTQ